MEADGVLVGFVAASKGLRCWFAKFGVQVGQDRVRACRVLAFVYRLLGQALLAFVASRQLGICEVYTFMRVCLHGLIERNSDKL